MKNKFNSMWRVMVALVLVASLGMVFSAVPVSSDPGVSVTIIECPSCPVPVSTDFGVKARVINTGSDEVTDVTVTCDASGPATVKDPVSINIGTLDPGETDTVAFTLHCTDYGSVTVTVSTNKGGSDWCDVDQAEPPALETGVSGPCQICTNCGENQFEIDAWVQNTGDVPASEVRLVISRSPTTGAHISGSTERWIGELDPGETKYIDTPWTAICDAEDDVTFTVTPSGENACTHDPITDITAGGWTVHQEDVLVDVICVIGLDSTGEPACGESCGDPNSHDWDVISSEQQVAITASVTNCVNTPKDLDIELLYLANTSLVGATAHVCLAGYETDMPVTDTGTGWAVSVDDVCGCCDVFVTWVLECTGAHYPEYITVNVTETSPGSGTWNNLPGECDFAWIEQVDKAHLTGELTAYVDSCDGGYHPLANTTSDKPAAVAVGQDFDVKITVENPGGAMAEDVTVDLRVENETDCIGEFYDIDFGDIAGGTTTGLWLSDIANEGVWCECLGEGMVNVTILDIDGTDGNTCEPVKTNNIDVPCPLNIQQCNFSIELMNPHTCDDICVGDAFAAKAKLTNCGPCDFYAVDFTLNSNGGIALATEEPGWTKTKDEILANPCPGECNEYEVTWNVVCTEPGDWDIWVCAESAQNGTTGDLHMLVKTERATVHQWIPPDISIDTLSPDSMDTFVATGQEFAVTAVITNNVGVDVTVYPSLYWMPEEGASFVGGPTDFVLGPYGEKTVTWTLECEKEGGLVINAEALGITDPCCPEDYAMSAPIVLWQYPAAHLDIDIIGVEPDTTVSVCDEFEVIYRVLNTGQSDATEVKAKLSVEPEGSARPVEGIDSGYTQEIGTLTGHGQDGQGELGEYIGHWNLHCKEACESTLTITAEGFDEYGWHKKQQCQSTGNFIAEAGCFYIEELTDEGSYSPERGWTYSLLIGEASGFIGPFSINAEVQGAAMGGGPDYLAHLDAMGLVVPAIDSDYVQDILDMMPGGCGDCDTLFDLLEEWEMQGLEKDAMFYVGHLVANTDQDDIIGGNYCVNSGYLQSINGNISGSELVFDVSAEYGYFPPEGVMSFLSGTYCSTMAKEALKAIPDEFIEPASVTVKQVERTADLGVTKLAVPDEVFVGEEVTFTVTVTNSDGPSAATGVRVTDLLPSGVNYSSYTKTQGWYDVTSGIWHVGDLAIGGSAVLYITATVNKVGEISNTATITACDLPDPTTTDNSAMATFTGLEPEAVEEWSIDLDYGYNLISLPLYIPVGERDTADVLAGVADNLDIAWAYSACADPGLRWTSYISGEPDPDLAEMRDGPGYWLIMDAADTLNVSGQVLPMAPETPPTYQVCEGWNLIGFKSTVPRTPGDYLAAIDDDYTIIYGFADGRYFVAGSSGHEYLEPGLGYWIAVIAEEGTIYP
jgi:uncharacterized repeat protein (TIGR01451 family)